MKTLLIIVSAITLLLFTSCEKDEMGPGGTGGGGKEESMKYSKSENIPTDLNKADDTLNGNMQVNDEKN